MRLKVDKNREFCLHCDGGFKELKSEDITYKEIWILNGFTRIRLHHEKKRCRCGQTTVRAKTPQDLSLGSSLFSHSFFAELVTSRLLDAIPVSRLSNRLKRYEYQISRQTLNQMLHKVGAVIKPIADRIRYLIKIQRFIQADGTHMPIYNELKCIKSPLWVNVAPEIGLCAYHNVKSEKSEDLKILMSNREGICMTDAQPSILNLTKVGKSAKKNWGEEPLRESVLCWAHMRRNFYKLLGTHTKFCKKVLKYIRKIYSVEWTCILDEVSNEEKLKRRQKTSAKYVKRLYKLLSKKQKTTLPKSDLEKAIQYAIGSLKEVKEAESSAQDTQRWSSFCGFLKDPVIPLDNNLSERLLRVISRWRDSSLWAYNEKSLDSFSDLLTVLQSCELRNVNPLKWLTQILPHAYDLPKEPKSDQIDLLLPGIFELQKKDQIGIKFDQNSIFSIQ